MLGADSREFNARLMAALLAGCVSLAVIGFEFFGGVTAPRLALIFSLAAGALALSSGCVPLKANSLVLGYFVLGATFFFSATISYVLVGGSDWAVVSWLLMALLGFFVCLGFLCSDVESQELTLELVFWVGVSFFVVLASYCLLLGVFGRPGYYFRLAADEFASVGLNRVVNAMVFFSGVAVVVGFGDKAASFWKRVSAVLLISFMLYFCFAAGARQGIVGVFLFISFYVLARFFREGVGAIGALAKLLMGFSLVGLVGYFLFESVGDDATEWFLSRFIGSLESQGSSGDVERLDALNAAIEFGFRNYGFGVGLGNFRLLHGIEPHNGYMGLFAEIGVYFFILNAFVLILFLIRYYSALRFARGQLALFLMAYLPVHFLFLINVKDLLREPFTWVVLGMAGVVWSGASFSSRRF